MKIFISMLIMLFVLILFSCDSDYSKKDIECPKHEIMCNNECVFIDEIVLYNLQCAEIKDG